MKSRFFRIFFFSFLIIALLPLLFGILAYNLTLHMISEDIRNNNHELLQKCMELLENDIEGFNRNANQIIMSKEIQDISLDKSPYVQPVLLSKFLNMNNHLDMYAYESSYIDEHVIYFSESDTLIKSGGYIYLRSKDFYNVYLTYGNLSYNEFYEEILNKNNSKFCFSAETLRKSNLGSQWYSDKTLLYVRPLLINGVFRGNILAFISLKNVEKTFINFDISSGGYISITDAGGNVLMAYPESAAGAGIHAINDATSEVSINGERMIVSQVVSPYNHWEYTSVLPYRIVMEKSLYMERLIIIIVLFSLLVSSAISFMLAFHFSRPLESVSKKLREFFSADAYKERGEFKFMKTSVTDLITEHNMLVGKIEQQTLFLRNNFYEKLLKGYYGSNNEALALAAQLGLKEFSGCVFIIAASVDSPLSNSGGELSKISAAKMSIKGIFAGCFPEIYFYDARFNTLIIVIGFGALSDAELESEVEKCALEAALEVSQQFGATAAFGFGGTAHQCMEIRKSYTDALAALNNRAGGTITKFRELVDNTDIYNYSIDEELRLINFVLNGNKDMVRKMLADIYAGNFEKRVLSPKMESCLLSDLICTVLKVSSTLWKSHNHEEELAAVEKTTLDLASDMPARDAFSRLEDALVALSGIKDNSDVGRTEKTMQRVKAYIDENYNDSNLGVAMIALYFKLSEGYLSRAYKEYSGTNLSSYIESVRMHHAVALMRGNYKIQEIADAVGYNNVYSFRKSFKKITGMLPGTYRDGLHTK